MAMTYECTWGERLHLLVLDQPGGLNHLTRIINDRAGRIGSRNTLAKLFDLDGPPEDGEWLVRAAYVLAALGQPLDVWGIDLEDLPPVHRAACDLRFSGFQEISLTAA